MNVKFMPSLRKIREKKRQKTKEEEAKDKRRKTRVKRRKRKGEGRETKEEERIYRDEVGGKWIYKHNTLSGLPSVTDEGKHSHICDFHQ